MNLIGIIAGSGLYDLPGLEIKDERTVSTHYGQPSSSYLIGTLKGRDVAFLSRHGKKHNIAPHKIYYRANIAGFKALGAERILGIYATGGIRQGLKPGDIVLNSQVLDMTQGARTGTFYDQDEVVHIDFTDPYCHEMTRALSESADNINMELHQDATYLCVNGPRLESRAEIKHMGMIGADVVGMTGMPEAALARELELCMAGISVITNYAAGISGDKLTTKEVIDTMQEASGRLKALLGEVITNMPISRGCNCGDSLKDTRM